MAKKNTKKAGPSKKTPKSRRDHGVDLRNTYAGFESRLPPNASQLRG